VRGRNLQAAQENGNEAVAPHLPAPPQQRAKIATSRARWKLVLLFTALGVVIVIGAILWFQRTEYFWRNPIAHARFETVTDFGGVEQAAASGDLRACPPNSTFATSTSPRTVTRLCSNECRSAQTRCCWICRDHDAASNPKGRGTRRTHLALARHKCEKSSQSMGADSANRPNRRPLDFARSAWPSTGPGPLTSSGRSMPGHLEAP
jgi:hypothetical protein